MEALDRADVKPGEEVIVSGMGPHGIILAQLFHHSNAQRSVAIGLVESRLRKLESYGITTILAERNDCSVHEAQLEKMFPNGVDIIVDTSGSWPMVQSLMKFLRKGGRFIQYGSYHSQIHIENRQNSERSPLQQPAICRCKLPGEQFPACRRVYEDRNARLTCWSHTPLTLTITSWLLTPTKPTNPR